MNRTIAMNERTQQALGKAANRPDRLETLKRYGEAFAALACGLILAVAYLLENVSHPWAVAGYAAAFAVGGFAKAKEGLRTLFLEKDLDVNLLMIVAAIGAAGIGYWTEGAVLIFIFSLSGAMESYTMDRSSRDIASLMDEKPETGTRIEDGREEVVPIEALRAGDTVVVRPGERLPSDGRIVRGSSGVNQAAITGESIPADKTVGDDVYAGTINGEGVLYVEVTQESESTLFAKIIRLVQEAQSEKPASQRFLEKFERGYARAIVLATFLLIVVPPLLLSVAWNTALYKAMVFLVVASPCALVASVMPAMLSAISNGARKGVLFKGGAHLDRLAGVKAVAFDKTGTLTRGRPIVTDIVPLDGSDGTEALRIAAALESHSGHPLAKAVVRAAEERGLAWERAEGTRLLTGWGMQGDYLGETWRIGKLSLLDGGRITARMASEAERLESEGKTVTVLANGSEVLALLAMRDQARPEAARAVARLKRQGIEVVMLTGDANRTAQAVAGELGISKVYAGLLPEDKVERIRALKREYGSVAMVGDGINDAPALATATVGIAMGAAGSDAALETADLVLMNDDTGRVADAIGLGKRARKIVKQNIVFALSVIVLLIAANFVEGIALPVGVVGHEGSTILVILNGLRLLAYRGGEA